MTKNNQRLAEAFDALAEASARVAIELHARDVPADDLPPMTGDATNAAPEWTQEKASGPTPLEQHGSEAVCPSHGKPFVEGRFGPYCTAQSDDPEWSNQRGYCTITPKNVAVFLRKTAAAGKR